MKKLSKNAVRCGAYAAGLTVAANSGLFGKLAQYAASGVIEKTGPVMDKAANVTMSLAKNLYDGYCSMR